MSAFLASPIVHGAISGAIAGAVVDFHAFLTFKSFADVKGYLWGVAAFRWLQGAVAGAVTAAGIAGVS